MKKCVTSFLVVTVVTTAFAAGAQTTPRKAKSVPSASDSDDPAPPDAPPSRAPSGSSAEGPLFQRLDTDDNGAVSESELLAAVIRHLRARVRVRFAQLDHNHDGRVSPDEVVGMSAARFSRFDLNRDGFFTASELELVMERKMIPRVARFLPRVDRDGDGRCNEAELRGHFETVARRKAPSRDGAVAETKESTQTKKRPAG